MKRYEILMNLALLLVIGGLIYLIYQSRELPRSIDELEVPVVASAGEETTGTATSSGRRGSASGEDADEGEEFDEDTDGADEDFDGSDAVRPPGTETEYGADGSDDGDEDGDLAVSGDDGDTTDSVQVASADADPEDQFGHRNIFRALLTPTPTPPPPTPTPEPTPDINEALGAWRLLSVYNGKALVEDVQLSAQEAEGAIWEMPVGGTKEVDVGNGVMKTATLKEISSDNPYNPEVIFSLEDTKTERKVNLDTEPVVAPAKKK